MHNSRAVTADISRASRRNSCANRDRKKAINSSAKGRCREGHFLSASRSSDESKRTAHLLFGDCFLPPTLHWAFSRTIILYCGVAIKPERRRCIIRLFNGREAPYQIRLAFVGPAVNRSESPMRTTVARPMPPISLLNRRNKTSEMSQNARGAAQEKKNTATAEAHYQFETRALNKRRMTEFSDSECGTAEEKPITSVHFGSRIISPRRSPLKWAGRTRA